MRNIEISDEIYERLKNLTTAFGQTPNDVLANLLNLETTRSGPNEPLVAFLFGTEFRSNFTNGDKYLIILGWIASRHGVELREYIHSVSSGSSGRRYLSLSQSEIMEQCRHNEARQIPGTQFWAIMNIDTATKRRFLARVLDFIGYDADLIELVCRAIVARRASRRNSLAVG